MRDEKLHAVVARSTFRSQMYKTPQRRTTLGSCDVEKVHAVVARSTFPSQNVQHTIVGPLLEVQMSEKVHAVVMRSTFRSQNVQSTPLSDHFWRFRCRKKCTLLRREAHFEVKMYKTHHCRTTFGGSDVEKVHAVVMRSTFRSQNVQSTPLSDHFWRFRCRKKCTLLRREAHFEVKMYKTHHCRTTFGGSDVGKSARCCDAKHISKSKC